MTARRIWIIAGAFAALGVAAFAAAWSGAFGAKQSARAESCWKPGAPERAGIPAGAFTMGAIDQYPEEGPTARVTVASFDIDTHEVTNAEFARFVAATGYVTSAERATELGFKAPGSAVFTGTSWGFVEGAMWRHPDGPDATIEGRDDEPVVQVSLKDAQAYAKWAHRALPTEAQWEYAARGGLDGATYAWGDALTPAGKYMANTWQGVFPLVDTGDDGHTGRAPVGCYAPNGYGVFDMIGNVWEWTADPYYPAHDAGANARNDAPKGFDPRQPDIPVGVIKGGSYLCAADYCARYRPAARHAQDTGLGTNHIGFRTVGRDATHPGP